MGTLHGRVAPSTERPQRGPLVPAPRLSWVRSLLLVVPAPPIPWPLLSGASVETRQTLLATTWALPAPRGRLGPGGGAPAAVGGLSSERCPQRWPRGSLDGIGPGEACGRPADVRPHSSGDLPLRNGAAPQSQVLGLSAALMGPGSLPISRGRAAAWPARGPRFSSHFT